MPQLKSCNGLVNYPQVLLLLFLLDPFRGMKVWRETMEPRKPGNSSRPRPESVDKKEVAKEQAERRVHSSTMQNEMIGLLGGITTAAARRIFNYPNSREIRVY